MHFVTEETPNIFVEVLKERSLIELELPQFRPMLQLLRMSGKEFVEMFDNWSHEQGFDLGRNPLSWFALTRLLSPSGLDRAVAVAFLKIARGEDPTCVLETDLDAETIANDRIAFAEGRRMANKAVKYARGIQAAVDHLLKISPDKSARQLWEEWPAGSQPFSIGDFELYRDGEELIQMEDSTGTERSIKFRAFQDYVNRGRTQV